MYIEVPTHKMCKSLSAGMENEISNGHRQLLGMSKLSYQNIEYDYIVLSEH